MTDFDVRMVHPYDLPEIWPQVRQHIANAAEYSNGRITEKSVLDQVLKNIMQLWVIMEDNKIVISFVTQVIVYNTGVKNCDIYALGGKNCKKYLNQFTEVISEWAKNIGCSSLEFVGRPGWEKILKNWVKLSVMLELPLGGQYGWR